MWMRFAVLVVSVMAACSEQHGASGMFDGGADAALFDAGPAPVQLTDELLEITGRSPSGRYVVTSTGSGEMVLLDATGARPPRRIACDGAAWMWRFSQDEETVACTGAGNLMVADVAGGPARTVTAWPLGGALADVDIDRTAANGLWDGGQLGQAELSADGRWILWAFGDPAVPGQASVYVSSTDATAATFVKRAFSQSRDALGKHLNVAMFVGDEIVFTDADTGITSLYRPDDGAVTALARASRFWLLTEGILLWDRHDGIGEYSLADVATRIVRPVAAAPTSWSVPAAAVNRDHTRAAFFLGDELHLYEAGQLNSLGAFPGYWLESPFAFTGDGRGIILQTICLPPTCTAVLVGVDGSSVPLGSDLDYMLTAPVVADAFVTRIGSIFRARPGGMVKWLGDNVPAFPLPGTVLASPEGDWAAFVSDTGAMGEVHVVDLTSNEIASTALAVPTPARSRFSFSDSGRFFVLDAELVLYVADKSGAVRRIWPRSVLGFVPLAGSRVAFSTVRGVFLLDVP